MRPQSAMSVRPSIRILRTGEVHVWSALLDASDEDTAGLAACLSSDEAERAARFRLPRDRRRFVVSRAAARHILGAYLGIPAREVAIRTDRRGKPHLDSTRHGAHLRFNLSHSRDLALVALGDREIGVDVEAARPACDADALVGRYFSREECDEYLALAPAERPRAFFAAWTLKEAYLKARGEGLAGGLDGCTVPMHPDAPARLIAVRARPGEAGRWTFARLAPAPGYVGAVAVGGPISALSEWNWVQAAQ
jgi:4'-phosphopantetheinyl transferase